jgi:hypothetical protein
MADEPQRRRPIDPSTAEILEDLERKQSEARLPVQERRKRIKAREKAKARLAGRVNWDLPPALKERVFSIAEEHRIPASQIATFLLDAGLERLESGEIDFEPLKTPSESPRYDWNLDFSDEL